MSNLVTKNNYVLNKTIAKNKASKELHISCQQAQKNASKQSKNCTRHTLNHAEKCSDERSKKSATLI